MNVSWRAAVRSIGLRLRSELRFKILMSIGLVLLWKLSYFSLQRMSPFEVRRLELTAIDRWIGFRPGWIWIYVSLYALLPTTPWLSTRRDHLARYTMGMVLVTLVCGLVFFFYPVACPRPEGVTANWLHAVVVFLDPETNAFPSLHCALATFTVLHGHRALAPDLPAPGRTAWILGNWLWVLLIFHSTVATGQHYFVDVPGGLAVAVGAHSWVWRGVSRGSVEGTRR